MTSMVVKAGFYWVLNATAPPEGSPWAEMGLDRKRWTLLCPPDDVFKHVNVTELLKDTEGLREIVGQHLIPTPSSPSSIFTSAEQARDDDMNRPISLRNDATYSTLLSPNSAYGDIVVRSSATPGGPLVLGIKGARGTSAEEDWANVLSWGRATTGDDVGGVIAIDRLFTPYHPSWFVEYGQPIGSGVLGMGLSVRSFGAYNGCGTEKWTRHTNPLIKFSQKKTSDGVLDELGRLEGLEIQRWNVYLSHSLHIFPLIFCRPIHG